jgi:CRP-like cAMP-binding protein
MIDLDLRGIPSLQWHPMILEAFDGLRDDDELRLTSDYDPRALRGELERTRPQQYVWLQHRLAHDLWEVTLRRMAAAQPDRIDDVLRRCPLFAGASPESVKRMQFIAMERTIAHGEPVAEQESDWDALGLVWRGSLAAIITSPLGREYVLYDVLSGEPFGEVAIAGRGSTIARFVATSQSARVLIFPKQVVISVLKSDFAVSRAMTEHLAQRMRAMVERFAAQTSLPTIARVADTLLQHAATDALGLQSVLPTLSDLSQVELAAIAGTVKEVVSRALAELESEGAIQRSGGRIVKIDRDRLVSHAKCL